LLSPFLVSVGALLWATDSLFRSKLVAEYSPLYIVTFSHLVCLFFTLPVFLYFRKKIKELSRRQWVALIFLATGGSAGAMILFTMAFKETTNYTVPILIQKLQPIIAISLASFILKEKRKKDFWFWSLGAIFGAYMVSFQDLNSFQSIFSAELKPILYAFGAATIWGGCTVAGRILLANQSFAVITSFRYVLATIFLLILSWTFGIDAPLANGIENDFWNFTTMALVAGLIALSIYYSGLKGTKASVAAICELSFPLGAIVINWIYLDSALSVSQLIGAVILIGCATKLSIENAEPTAVQS